MSVFDIMILSMGPNDGEPFVIVDLQCNNDSLTLVSGLLHSNIVETGVNVGMVRYLAMYIKQDAVLGTKMRLIDWREWASYFFDSAANYRSTVKVCVNPAPHKHTPLFFLLGISDHMYTVPQYATMQLSASKCPPCARLVQSVMYVDENKLNASQ
eukprot:NODE_975_length_1193_cov_65.867133_g737_i0.p1 GENE.NODE_975_length_1193_cov_65.867133_g737_i0~~NODE_975_length_1193_cov_65.867133_g737_i0.p1  ORF type:complete len:155 (+),score=28.78 NODE_975_length_1193_cov_65.867133_g737_i0:709-1173(+)